VLHGGLFLVRCLLPSSRVRNIVHSIIGALFSDYQEFQGCGIHRARYEFFRLSEAATRGNGLGVMFPAKPQRVSVASAMTRKPRTVGRHPLGGRLPSDGDGPRWPCISSRGLPWKSGRRNTFNSLGAITMLMFT